MEELDRNAHTMWVEGRATLHATGVSDVSAVTEAGVCAATCMGLMVVSGRGLKVIRLDADTGELLLTGEIRAVSYAGEQKPRSWLARLFR